MADKTEADVKTVQRKKIASYVGLAQRAGAALYGCDIIAEKLSKVKLVLIDAASPQKYASKLTARCAQKNVDVFVIDGLKQAAHKENINALGITNTELAEAIINLLR